VFVRPVQFFEDRTFPVDAKLCFVIMPFAEQWSARIYKEIRETVENRCDFQYECRRADDFYGKVVLGDIWQRMNEASFIIADLTNQNPNVFYELGLAHALGKDVIPILQNGHTIPFDQQPFRILFYEDNSDGYEILRTRLPEWIAALEYQSAPIVLLKRGMVDRFNDKVRNSSRLMFRWEDLQGVDLSGANFRGAMLSEALLSQTTGSETIFSKTNCIRTEFDDAEYLRPTFEGANLSEAFFRRAKLESPNFRGAILIRTNWEGAAVRDADISAATFDESTFNQFVAQFPDTRGKDLAVVEIN
jgi:uncharacterized protein YjbI with pentapeptide repeats